MSRPCPAMSATFLVSALALAAVARADTTLPAIDCLIVPFDVVEVSTRIDGTLERVEIERGDLVEKGRVIATLESSIEQAEVELARARVEARATIEAREASLAFSRRKQARTEELFQTKAISFNEKDAADTEVRLAELQMVEAEEARRIARLELERAERRLALRTITSPVAGVVVERLASAGESVEGRPIVRIAQIHPLNVELIVPVDMLNAIRVGMRAEVTPEGAASTGRVAEVRIVDRVVDAKSGTFGVRLELANDDYALASGLRCDVRFLVDTAPGRTRAND